MIYIGKTRFVGVLFALLFMPIAANAQYFWQEEGVGTSTKIEEIRIEGSQRIERNTILSYLDVSEGDVVTDRSISRSIRSLYSTGLFADVGIDVRGNDLIINVVENPVINQIAFEGNKRITDEELLSEINLRPRTVFTRTKIQDNVDRLYEIYRRTGRFSTFIDPKVIKLDQNRVDLVFEIDEGFITKIKNISFVGNEKFSDSTLRSEVSSKEKEWYRFFTSNDRYDADRLNFDQELLRRFYLKNGYADFQVKSTNAELSKDKKTFYVTFNVEEGERYRVSNVGLSSKLKNFDTTVLQPQVSIEEGQWYDADQVQEDIDSLVEELGNRQYAFVDVRPSIQRNKDDNTVSITYRIDEAPKVFVEKIDIKGNVRTLDKVVRREFEFVEGDPFNREKLAKSETNINDLGYFETVTVTPKPGSAPDKTVIETQVSEKSTGEISIGAGFSTNDGPLADFRISERNLLGTGRRLGLTTVVAGLRSQFEVSLTEPYFLNRDLAASINVFRTTRDFQDESSFDQKRTGAGYSLDYPLAKNLRQTLRYNFEQNELENVDSNASLFIQLQEGERTNSAISQRLEYDVRDSIIDPTEGYNLWWDTELAGLGGDAQYVGGVLGGQAFYEIFDGVVFSKLLEGGHRQSFGGDDGVTINERFFLGLRQFRGFDRFGVGPRDLLTEDAVGGNTYYRGSFELSAPLTFANADEQGIKWHVFTDYGTLFGLDQDGIPGTNIADDASLRVSAGVGISWLSPFGPIRVNLANPIVDEDYDEDRLFDFSFGTRF